MDPTYQKDKTRHWGKCLKVDECHGVWHVPVPGTDEEEAGGGEDPAVDGPERRARHEQRHDPCHYAKKTGAEGLK